MSKNYLPKPSERHLAHFEVADSSTNFDPDTGENLLEASKRIIMMPLKRAEKFLTYAPRVGYRHCKQVWGAIEIADLKAKEAAAKEAAAKEAAAKAAAAKEAAGKPTKEK
jgi:hypothetical protein